MAGFEVTPEGFARLYSRLGRAGLNGSMLKLKESSLDEHVNQFVGTLSANQEILTVS
jgi:hypothetical protein